MHIDEFSLGDSFFHLLDERVKIPVFTLFSLHVALISSLYPLLLYFAAAFFFCLFSKLNSRKVLQRLYAVNIFILFFWIIIPLSFPGDTRGGVEVALSITLKANAIAFFVISLIGTSALVNNVSALQFFGMPGKLAGMFYFCNKYISVLHSDYIKLKEAMKMKGFIAKTNLKTYKTMGTMLGVLLLKSRIHSATLYDAMLCRGFKGRFPSFLREKLKINDIVFTMGSAIFVSFMLWIQ